MTRAGHTSRACAGCRALAAATPGIAVDPLNAVVAAMLHFGEHVLHQPTDALCAVVGEPRLPLPCAARARGPFVFLVMSRVDLVTTWVKGDPMREAMAARLASPPTPGRFWMMVGLGSTQRGIVTLFDHDLIEPSAAARTWVELAMVPPDGGPALGRRVVAGGVS